MSDSADHQLGMDRSISRRDFLDGIAIAVGMSLLPAGCRPGERAAEFAPEREPGYYPPGLTGLRGSHPGSFEVAHQLRDGTLWPTLGKPRATGEHYDLVIVGGGISGLSAAHFYHKARGENTRVLILENHDDVGGHAKRNEFTVGDRTMVTYGGTESIESPAQYSDVARGVLTDIGIDVQRFYTAFDQKRYEKLDMVEGTFFDKETFGADLVLPGGRDELDRAFLAKAPVSAAARRDLLRLFTGERDYLPGLSSAEKKQRLSKTSYRDFLIDIAKLSPEILPFLQHRTHDLYGVGIEAVPALDCWWLEFPGFAGLKLDEDEPNPGMGLTPNLEWNEEEPYIFHFPDGNASVARLLLRRLLPAALPGSTMEDAITARLDYSKLDDAANPTRVQLNSSVVKVQHVGDPASANEVEITYVRGGKPLTVRAKACVLACWNMVIPYLCPEMPEPQKQALAYEVKVPMIYANAALKNWQAFQKLGVFNIHAPGAYYSETFIEFPVDLGGYQSSHTPDEPMVVKMVRTPCSPGKPSRDQHRAGRFELFNTPFETYERNLRDQLGRMLGPAGFDPATDITAITVNRWSHGYSYEYNSLWDGPWAEDQQPCVIGRQRFGRIAVANADAGAFAYTNGAIDQASRAVNELLALSSSGG